jgi:phosphonate transport system substrate-binding protein
VGTFNNYLNQEEVNVMKSRLIMTHLLLAVAIVCAPLLGHAAEEKTPLVLGIVSSAEPVRVYAEWQAFADYLSGKLERPVKMLVPRGLDKLAEAADKGEVDVFYVNSLIYYRLMEKNKAIPVAQLQNVNGRVLNTSVVFVRTDSKIQNLRQLKGEKMAYISPLGSGGYLAPRALMYKEGVQAAEQVKEEFTQNISSSVHKVLLGDAKAGTMCGLTYKLISNKIDTRELSVIAVTDDYPEDMVGARPGLAPATLKLVTKVLLDMNLSDNGRKILSEMEALRIEKFVPYDAKITEPVTRKLLQQAHLK